MTAPAHRDSETGTGDAPSRRDLAVAAFRGPRVPVVAPPGSGADLEYDDARTAAGSAREAALTTPGGVPAGVVLRLGPPVSVSGAGPLLDRLPQRLPSHVVAVVVPATEPAAIAGLRRRGVTVVAGLGEHAGLAGAAVAAGADGLWLDTPGAGAVGQAREAAARLAPLVRPAVPDTLAECRQAIDGVDAAIATLLEHRVALAGRVQRLKPVGGQAGRDPRREAEIVAAMATRAPSLPADRLARIMAAVIEAGLEVSERNEADETPVWRM